MQAPELVNLLADRRLAVLTGAGISTDSGIPDYRGPDSPPSNPMTIQQFLSGPAFRQRYWARNHIGWRHMAARRPNAGHRAVAALERAGLVTGVITQNVDGLHQDAGSRDVLELHGTLSAVVCLACGATESRDSLQARLAAAAAGVISARCCSCSATSAFARSSSAAVGKRPSPQRSWFQPRPMIHGAPGLAAACAGQWAMRFQPM